MLYMFKMLSLKNGKKLELEFAINQLPFITDLNTYRYLYAKNAISVDNLATNNLLFIKDIKIRNGCKLWLIIATSQSVA